MKTRKVLMAMVLPALFAACTSEDFVETTPSLNGRALLGDGFTVEVSENNASTRFAWEPAGWKFEAGDEFGAGVTDPTQGTISSDKMLGNYIFTKGANGYSTTSQMYEGIYLFYSYDGFQKKDTRDLIAFDLGLQKADLSKPEEAISKSKAKLFFSPLYKVEAGKVGIALPLNFYPYWGVAAVKIKNDTEASFKISQIILTDGTTAFTTKGQIDPTKLSGAKLMYSVSKEGKYELPEGMTAEKYNEAMASVNLAAAGAVETSSIVLDCMDYELAVGKEVVAYMNVPAGKHTGTNLTVKVVAKNTKGETKSVTSEGLAAEFKHGTTKAVFGLNDDKTMMSWVIEGLGDAPEELYIDNKADLKAAIQGAKNAIIVNNLGDLAIDNDIASALVKAKGVVTFKNPIAVKVASKATINNVKFEEDVTVEGEVTFDAGKTAATNMTVAKSMTVKAGKTILKAGTFSDATVNVEGGEVELAKADLVITKVDVKKGTLTVSTDQSVASAKIKALSFGSEAANALNVVASTDDEGEVVDTELEIDKVTVALNAKTTTTIDEHSTISLTGNTSSILTNNGVMSNNGKIAVASNGVLTNAATGSIENAGTIETIVNSGYVKVTSVWASTALATGSTGVADNTVGSTITGTATGHTIYRLYSGSVSKVTANAELAVFYNATLEKDVELADDQSALMLGANTIAEGVTLTMGQSAESPTLQIGLNAAALNGNDFKIALVVAKGDLTGKEANPAGQAASINKAVETYVLGTISAAALPIKNYGSVSKNAGTITFLNSGSAGMDNTTWIPEGNLDPQS